MNTESVDAWLAEGCGRCDRYRTPACKVHRWTPGLVALRELLSATELVEEMKWGNPCYTLGGKNVTMIAAFNESFALTFFKGSLLDDPAGALELPGPASHVGRLMRFTDAAQVHARRDLAADFLAQAIRLERSGAKVDTPRPPDALPAELEAALEADPVLRVAFEALTPGRRRSHILHIAGAKQASTRAARVLRCAPKILAGLGFHDH